MNSEMQKRLYEMEVTPPAAVWEKLSVDIDEINEDILLSKKILNAELTPPQAVWEKIDSTINPFEVRPMERIKRPVINLRRLAAAAVFIGIIVTGWLVFRNYTAADRLTTTTPGKKTETDTNINKKIENPNFIDSPVDQSGSGNREVASNRSDSQLNVSHQFVRTKRNNYSRNQNIRAVQPTTAQFASLNEPMGKSFNQPIDDLSLVTADQNYLTMVNANGRLVKIPAQLASLAPHLQDKPVVEDYAEVMFGEGSYWKETLSEWRKKLVSAPVASGDAFTSFVELLKSVQNK